MRRSLRFYLIDIVEAGEAVLLFTKNKSFDDYISSDLLRSATERKFEIIGEAIAQASALYPDFRGRIAFERDIVAFRNRVIHGYFAVEDSVVWSIVCDYLPDLLRDARDLLKESP